MAWMSPGLVVEVIMVALSFLIDSWKSPPEAGLFSFRQKERGLVHFQTISLDYQEALAAERNF